MSSLPILAFFGGIGATFLVFPYWSSIVWNKKKGGTREQGKLLIEMSSLLDSRLIDLAASGLLDKRLLLSHGMLKGLYQGALSEDEQEKAKAKKGLEHFRRLESMQGLDLIITEESSPKLGDSFLEMVFLAKTLEAHLLISDPSLQDLHGEEPARVINLHQVIQSFRNPIQGGEKLMVKIQRTGKELGQGVGYLEDGTMVVVNGASQSVGELVEAYVLSIKHNTAGRMVFCNTKEEQGKPLTEGVEKRRPFFQR